MDNLTHGLAGALLAHAGWRQRCGNAATVALVLGAELPDLDVLFDLAGPVTALQHHRGMTHAFVGGLGLALLGAAVLYRVLRYRHYWHLVALVYLGVVLHLAMDYLTAYGTQLWLPFTARRDTADAIFIIDLTFTGLLLTALLLVRMLRQQRQRRYGRLSVLWFLVGIGLWLGESFLALPPLLRLLVRSVAAHLAAAAAVVGIVARLGRHWPAPYAWRVARCGLVAVAAYVAMCLGAHAIARERFAAALPPVEIQRVAALPVPGGGPLRWRGIAETPTGYVVGDVRLLSSTRTPPRFIAKGLDHHLVSRLNEYRLVRVFLDFARFPVVEWQSQGTRQVVRYYDLRFVVPGRQRSWFDLEVHLDGHGQVQAIAFLRRVFRPGHPDF